MCYDGISEVDILLIDRFISPARNEDHLYFFCGNWFSPYIVKSSGLSARFTQSDSIEAIFRPTDDAVHDKPTEPKQLLMTTDNPDDDMSARRRSVLTHD